jgi:hypothetical protein
MRAKNGAISDDATTLSARPGRRRRFSDLSMTVLLLCGSVLPGRTWLMRQTPPEAHAKAVRFRKSP